MLRKVTEYRKDYSKRMRKVFRLFLVAAFIAAAFFVTHYLLLPLVYRVKEPYFEMPTRPEITALSRDKLPVRNDAYGDGWFGAKRKNGRTHKGLDLAAELQSPVYASKSGWAKTYCYPKGYGNLVVINHPGGWQTRYGHLDKIEIKKFQWIRQGDIIGTVGKTGNANARGIMPHLHFEIRHKGEAVDPEEYLLQR